jgi:hypothetical protein
MHRRAARDEKHDRDTQKSVAALADQNAKQQNRSHTDDTDACQDHRRHSTVLMQPCKENVRQPFPGKPGLPGSRIGKDVLMRHLSVRQNPLTGAYVPAGVAVAQHARGPAHAQK